jgi:hypothetical protein
MAMQVLINSYPLDVKNIDLAVTKKSAGVYALGTESQDGKTFLVRYVGRSNDDVNRRLKDHVEKYYRFMYQYCVLPKDAFESECHLYHDFGETKLDNEIHPRRPDNSGWKCPRCEVFR